MAEDKKDDKKEEGGEQNFAVIPMKYITPIIIILIVIGTVGKMIAPNLTTSIGPMIIDPFSSILWAYGFLMILFTWLGDKKSAGQILVSISPMLILAIVIVIVFEAGIEYVIGPLMLMIIGPFLGNALKKKGEEYGLVGLGEEEKKIEPALKNIVTHAEEIKDELPIVRTNARKVRKTLGAIYPHIGSFYAQTDQFAQKLMRKEEKELKKESTVLAQEAGMLKQNAENIDQDVFNKLSAIPPTRQNKLRRDILKRVSDSLENIIGKLNTIHNALA